MTSFDGATVVVTGAASGIGLANRTQAARRRCHRVGCDLTPAAALAGADRFTFVAADVTDVQAVARVFEAAPPRLAGVVHSAGVPGGGPSTSWMPRNGHG